MGCSLADRIEHDLQFMVGTTHVQVYMGPKPKFGIAVTAGDKYVLPGQTSQMLKVEYHRDAAKSSFPRKFFTEIFSWTEVEVSSKISEDFHSKQPNSEKPLLQLAHTDSELFNSAVDIVAATIGLRYHWQFLTKIINENFIAIRDNNEPAFDITSPAMRVLEDVRLKTEGITILSKELERLTELNEGSWQNAADILLWLMRAWVENDTLTKFVNLFIPLEMILSRYAGENNQRLAEQAQSIRAIIHEHQGGNNEDLIDCVNHLMERQRPSLSSRFEEMVYDAKMVGWEGDILAFKKFNNMRNALLHRGQVNITTRITVHEEEVRDLEDLVERYISFGLFGDGRVYQSRFRVP